MKILLAASEVAPLIKVGGLGDVVGSLPIALEKLGVDVDIIVPFYTYAEVSNFNLYKSLEIEVPFGGEIHTVVVYKTKLPDSEVDVILLQNLEFFDFKKEALPVGEDQSRMYGFFSGAVVEYIKSQFNTYDLVHCQDWHTGMITHLLEDQFGIDRPKTLFTIHNLLYQGSGSAAMLKDMGVLPGEHALIDWDMSDTQLNFMFQGITSSDFVSTVSTQYAKEIKTKEFGGALSDELIAREERLTGILNGINYSQFPKTYHLGNWQSAKAKAKEDLQRALGLDVKDAPIFAFVSRLDPGQKGLEILYPAVGHINYHAGQFVLLGTGAKDWETRFSMLNDDKHYRGNVACKILFDNKLALDIYQASDFLIIPSKYEPCGLTQMIAMTYGTLPIVRAVGGLKDTVVNDRNGITFNEYSNESLLEAINKAFALYKDKEKYRHMVEVAMKEDFSWDRSALAYKELYTKVISS
ncbi:glycogen synthase [Patescibacteria group bacterium]|nr:glycogen synthase [Patescibacteria group bacterium]